MAAIDTVSALLIECLKHSHKILICGNGGSSAQASHFAAELVVRYKQNRRALPCLALNDPAILTACANDLGYEQVFARQVQAYAQEGDVLIAISTSGKSPNVLKAIERSLQLGVPVLALTGPDGVFIAPDAVVHGLYEYRVSGHDTAAVQEVHMRVLHALAMSIEEHFAKESSGG